MKYKFDTRYKISADYFLMLQIITNKKFSMKFIKTPFVAMALGGTALKYRGFLRGNKEIKLINKRTNFNETILIRYLRNLMQILLNSFIKFRINDKNLLNLNEFN